MKTEDPAVLVAVRGHTGVLELNRPHKFNCLSLDSHLGLLEGVREFASNPQVRCILILSAGKHFCTGADLDFVEACRIHAESLAEFVAVGHAAFKAIEAARLPTVVAVQGLCLAGGLELMLSCDIAFAASDAQLGDQHAAYGLVPGWGGSQRLPRIVGMRRAMDLFYTAKRLDARTAHDWGLVNHVSEPERLREDAFAYCQSLASRSPVGMACMKRLSADAMHLPLIEALAFEERVALEALQHEDVREGLEAFRNRRAPVFAAASRQE